MGNGVPSTVGGGDVDGAKTMLAGERVQVVRFGLNSRCAWHPERAVTGRLS
jgi:hypothetical protein